MNKAEKLSRYERNIEKAFVEIRKLANYCNKRSLYKATELTRNIAQALNYRTYEEQQSDLNKLTKAELRELI